MINVMIKGSSVNPDITHVMSEGDYMEIDVYAGLLDIAEPPAHKKIKVFISDEQYEHGVIEVSD